MQGFVKKNKQSSSPFTKPWWGPYQWSPKTSKDGPEPEATICSTNEMKKIRIQVMDWNVLRKFSTGVSSYNPKCIFTSKVKLNAFNLFRVLKILILQIYLH